MNCKPGDDAIILKSINPANIGRLVKVMHFVGELHAFQEYDLGDGIVREAIVDGNHWYIVPLGSPIMNANGKEVYDAVHPDTWLQPIRDTKKETDKVSERDFERVY